MSNDDSDGRVVPSGPRMNVFRYCALPVAECDLCYHKGFGGPCAKGCRQKKRRK